MRAILVGGVAGLWSQKMPRVGRRAARTRDDQLAVAPLERQWMRRASRRAGTGDAESSVPKPARGAATLASSSRVWGAVGQGGEAREDSAPRRLARAAATEHADGVARLDDPSLRANRSARRMDLSSTWWRHPSLGMIPSRAEVLAGDDTARRAGRAGAGGVEAEVHLQASPSKIGAGSDRCAAGVGKVLHRGAGDGVLPPALRWSRRPLRFQRA